MYLDLVKNQHTTTIRMQDLHETKMTNNYLFRVELCHIFSSNMIIPFNRGFKIKERYVV